MANSAQARKRARQAVQRRAHNVGLRSRFRTFVKKAVKAMDANDLEGAETAVKEALPIIDRTVSKGLIHKNKGARQKSRLNARLKSMKALAAS